MSSFSCEIIDKQTREVLPTLSHNGQKYIVTEAGTEFEVKVRLNNLTGQEHKVINAIGCSSVAYPASSMCTAKT
jgi:hypothetical protein